MVGNSKISAGLRQMAKTAGTDGSWSTRDTQRKNYTQDFDSTSLMNDGLSDAVTSMYVGQRAGKTIFEEAEQRRLQAEEREKELDRAEFLASPNANSW